MIYILDNINLKEKILAIHSRKGVTKVPKFSCEYEKIAPNNIQRSVMVGTGSDGLFCRLSFGTKRIYAYGIRVLG